METEIIEKLKSKGLSDKSIKLYMTILKSLNDKREIRNMDFLKNPKKILDKITKYKPTTQRNVLIAIVSVLKNLNNDANLKSSKDDFLPQKKSSAFYSDLYKSYYDKMIEMNKSIEESNKENLKTETQNENWIKWEDVEKKFLELESKLKGSKNISEDGYNAYLDAVILALYVLVPPRRNVDYLLMKVSKEGKFDEFETSKKYNWLDLKKKQFVFNNYKTKKSYGQQILDVPPKLMELIKKYLKYKKDGDGFLLVKFSGERLKSDNAITRRLNKIFDKNISSSMLRHIYLSDKYAKVNKEMKKDSEAMAHSLDMQKEYIKN